MGFLRSIKERFPLALRSTVDKLVQERDDARFAHDCQRGRGDTLRCQLDAITVANEEYRKANLRLWQENMNITMGYRALQEDFEKTLKASSPMYCRPASSYFSSTTHLDSHLVQVSIPSVTVQMAIPEEQLRALPYSALEFWANEYGAMAQKGAYEAALRSLKKLKG